MVNDRKFWNGRRVLITGHTGFKGSWLSLILQELGADLAGYALEPPSDPSLFALADVAGGMRSIIADVRDLASLRRKVDEFEPEVVFHLAAQSLVRTSYEEPVDTFSTNVMGTVNVLEALRTSESVRSIVVVTTDKVYENREWAWGYRETDRLGGKDPYSASKACAEIATASYRDSFYGRGNRPVGMATARAGNVIGGGDWARDRLVPDAMTAFLNGHTLEIRNPRSIRPWQHVLEPLAGYMELARALWDDAARFSDAWNFGPAETDSRSVAEVVTDLAELWGPEAKWEATGGEHPPEARTLRLDCSRSLVDLGWRCRTNLRQGLEWTVQWYRSYGTGADARDLVSADIRRFGAL